MLRPIVRALGNIAVCLALSLVAAVSAKSQVRVWVMFRDKGISQEAFKPGNPKFDRALKAISTKALTRRRQALYVSRDEDAIQLEDCEVDSSYLRELGQYALRICGVSKWQNAALIATDTSTLNLVRALPFVAGLQSPALQRNISPENTSQKLMLEPFESIVLPKPMNPGSLATSSLMDTTITWYCGYDSIIYRYGLAESQLDRINVKPLHAMGFTGRGIRMGFLDTGARWRSVSPLFTRNIISEYDYIFQDSNVANDSLDNPDQDSHGTSTLSCAIGYVPDTLIGPAFNATVMLAKTEDLRSETTREEDYYVHALEDMEARGVMITSSSVGYFHFDNGIGNYSYTDLNGHTTITARGLARAAKLGLLCVTSMGNSGTQPESHLITPADADSIISSGALGPDDSIADFSSRGPTSDDRIKPEICAPGVGVYAVNPANGYGQVTGTSFSAPLTSSACALIMQAHPEATAQQIRRAIMTTGSRSSHPDTAYGWGKLNAYAAALELGPVLSEPKHHIDSVIHFCVGAASEFGVRKVFLTYGTGKNSREDTIQLHLVEDSLIYAGDLRARSDGGLFHYQIHLVDNIGDRRTMPLAGYYFIQLSSVHQLAERTAGITLSPNPSRDYIEVANLPGEGNINIYNGLGERVLSKAFTSETGAVRINVISLSAGWYHVIVLGGDAIHPTTAQTQFVIER